MMPRKWNLEIVIPLEEPLPDNAEFADLTAVEMALMKAGSKVKASLVASEVGGSEARMAFECGHWRAFAEVAVGVLSEAGRARDSLRFELSASGLAAPFEFSGGETISSLPFPDDPPKRRPCRLYDCFAIPLGDGRWGHCQLMGRVVGLGDAVRVLDLYTEGRPGKLEEIRTAGTAFWPVLVWVAGGVDFYKWQHVGHFKPVLPVVFPLVRYSRKAESSGFEAGVYDDWKIIDLLGPWESQQHVGTLNPEQRALEFKKLWLAEELRERLRTGTHPVLFAV